MGTRNNFLLAVLFSVLLTGCAGALPEAGPERTTGAAPALPLSSWVEKELIPYLVEQLGSHPRFKGQPFLVVRMTGDNVEAEIDDLTAQIRERVLDALLTESGIKLIWRPAIKPWRHHRRLEDIACAEYRKIRFYVGIDVGLTKVDRELYVKVRALNLDDEAWVSGFGLTWRGTPDASHMDALGRGHTDEYLRGLRPLPFTEQQPDLLASYLAHNLSCLFREKDTDEIVVYVDRQGIEKEGFFRTTLDLLSNYLARFREVNVTDDPDQANLIINTETHPIHGGLFQVWVSARFREGMKYLPGAETEAYALLGGKAPPLGRFEEKTEPVEAPPEMSPEQVKTGESQGISPPLISSFRLLTPVGQAFCGTKTPWLVGEREIEPGEHLPSGGCLAMEVKLTEPAHIFLVGQDGNGLLTRFFPTECEEFGALDALAKPDEPFRFPPLRDSLIKALVLYRNPGVERIYAVAVKKPAPARRFLAQIEKLQGLCAEGKEFIGRRLAGDPDDRINEWQAYLALLEKKTSGSLEWQVRRFIHDPSVSFHDDNKRRPPPPISSGHKQGGVFRRPGRWSIVLPTQILRFLYPDLFR